MHFYTILTKTTLWNKCLLFFFLFLLTIWVKLILFPHLQFYRFLITAGRNVSKKVYGQLRDHKITPALQDRATPSPAGRQRAVSSSHTSMLTTARKPPSEHSLWIGVTFDWLSAARCVSIKDDVLYGSWSEWRTCSYKHALQFSPRCEAERLSNQPSEGTSQNEWESRSTLHDGHLQNLVSVIGFVLFLLPSHPPNFLISLFFFLSHKQNNSLFFFPFLLEHAQERHSALYRSQTHFYSSGYLYGNEGQRVSFYFIFLRLLITTARQRRNTSCVSR